MEAAQRHLSSVASMELGDDVLDYEKSVAVDLLNRIGVGRGL